MSEPMLSGMRTVGESMFGQLGEQKIGPSPEEMIAERERIQFKRHVDMKKHCVKVFNMHDAVEVAAYEKLMKKLIVGVQAKTHYVWANDLQVLTVDGKQRWMKYLEWSEYALEEEAVAPVGVADTKE